ncbi:hypothetical protein [Jatrophihabitans endophyticus]|uniref:hypothetical protein n=1 Tax=Jatrophihabitans endophyticus TaxID=1206085 RepID=UPI0019EBFC94|nr:hypothetical protein [Jatrophihabitans endophyticus]MBE7187703.1 hypothetical protein [Jatrophihabitans endophyticus]
MRTDLFSSARTRRVGPRVLVVTVAALAVAFDAPAWLTTVLTAVAFLVTAERLVRRRQLGWADAVVTGAAGLVIVLMLLGFLLDVVPGGLARVSWGVGAGVVALAALAWSERAPDDGPATLPVERGTLVRVAPAYAVATGLAAIALVVSVHATREGTRAPEALSIVRTGAPGQVSVEISSGRAAGRYELAVTSRGHLLRVDGPFTLAPDSHVRRTVPVPSGRRSTIELRSSGSSAALRTLVVSPATTGSR